MVQTCCVKSCKNNALNKGISMHSFPKNPYMRQEWIKKLNFIPTSKNMRICSEHFLPTDYQVGGKKYRILRKLAVPSIFKSKDSIGTSSAIDYDDSSTWSSSSVEDLHQDSSMKSSQLLSSISVDHSYGNNNETVAQGEQLTDVTFHRIKLENIQETANLGNEMDMERNTAKDFPMEMVIPNGEGDIVNDLHHEIELLINELATVKEERDAYKVEMNKMSTKIQELEQVVIELRSCRTLEKKFCLNAIKEKTTTLKYYTGFDDLNLFKAFFDYITSEGSISFSKKLDVNDQVLLVLAKLRQGFDFEDLAFRFNVDQKLVAKVFTSYINVMFVRVGCLNLWPRGEMIFQSMPQKFLEKYPNTIIIIDVIELKIENPNSPVSRTQSSSAYKSPNTAKSLIGCSPNGDIMFISQLFIGSISDKKIIEESGFYDCLKEKLESGEINKGDSIMVDKAKASNIKSELENLGLKINIFPSASDDQFLEEEVVETRQMASCQIYVERAMKQVKRFKILKYGISLPMMDRANQIWTVCCFLANLRRALKPPGS